MSTSKHTSGYGLASDYMVGLPHNPHAPDPLPPRTDVPDAAALAARRAACPHSRYTRSAWDITCTDCGVLHPESWLKRVCGVGR